MAVVKFKAVISDEWEGPVAPIWAQGGTPQLPSYL